MDENQTVDVLLNLVGTAVAILEAELPVLFHTNGLVFDTRGRYARLQATLETLREAQGALEYVRDRQWAQGVRTHD